MNTTNQHHSALHTIRNVRDRLKTCTIFYVSNSAASLPNAPIRKTCNERIEDYLTRGHFAWFAEAICPEETAYILYNIALHDAWYIVKQYPPRGVIHIDNRADNPYYQYWEQDENGKYAMAHERTAYIDMEDAADFFTRLSQRCHLPFLDADGEQLLSAHYNLIDATIRRKIQRGRFDEQYVSNAIERSLLPKMYSGRRLWELRGIIYGGYRNPPITEDTPTPTHRDGYQTNP